MNEKKKLSLTIIGFFQALGLTVYCGLVGLLFAHGDKLFGKKPGFWTPALLLVIFCASALICALITLGYPIILFWEKKERTRALKLVALTAGWLILFIFSGILLAVLLKHS